MRLETGALVDRLLERAPCLCAGGAHVGTAHGVQHIGALSDEEMREYQHVLRDHLPGEATKPLVGKLQERVPRQYQNAIVACVLASRMVYKEGVRFIDSLPAEGLAKLALKYMQAERQVGEELLPALEACDMSPELMAQARAVLEQAAARIALTSQN